VIRRALVIVALVASALAVPATRAAAKAIACGKLDLPETGLQGEVPARDQVTGRALRGYNCGLALVGRVALPGPAANMAWAGHCAFVATTGSGIMVVDVSDPRHPRHTATLHGPGSEFSIETIAAKQVGNRITLVAGRYGLTSGAPIPAPMDVYDATNCAHPRKLTTFRFPSNIHNLAFSPDGSRVFTTLPIQVADIRDPAHPKFLGNIENQIAQPNPFGAVTKGQVKYLGHEIEFSADGNTMYVGGQTAAFNLFSIIDITNWPARKPRLISQVEGRGHSVRLASINGRTYVVHSEESIVNPTAKGCVTHAFNPMGGAAQPWMSDVTDPAHPVMWVSQMRLAINDKSNCLREVADSEDASVHYQDVDDPRNTTFVMASMWNAGLRLFDVRDPRHPNEVAYFNPGSFFRPTDATAPLDKAWGHVRYDAATGQIWFATQSGGFWVVELEPQVRAKLGLPAVNTVHPNGSIPKPVNAIGAPAAQSATQYYCTLGPLSF
jgi:hypothetical protein